MSTLDTIKQDGRIVVGWAPYAPYASLNPKTKQPEGVYVDLFDRLAEEAGWQVTWVPSTWSTMASDLSAGKFVAFAAPVFKTIPRAEQVAFTRAIDSFGLNAVVRADDDRFHELANFNQPDVTVAVTQGEVGQEFAAVHLPNANENVHRGGDIALALVDVIESHADAAICDSWTAKEFVDAHPGKVKLVFTQPFNRVGAGWFVRQGDQELLEFLNTAIEWLQSTGTVDEIEQKYGVSSATAR